MSHTNADGTPSSSSRKKRKSGSNGSVTSVHDNTMKRNKKKPKNNDSDDDDDEVGSHFAHGASGQVNDEWQTSKESWATIAPYFESYKRKRVWMPFYYDGACAKYMKELGFKKILHADTDFFKKIEKTKFISSIDLILDNPPYTGAGMKERVLRALVATNKPFVMLLPSSVLHSKYLHDILDTKHIQCIYPRRVHVRKTTDQDTVPFKYMIWLCYRTRLPRDIIFL